MPNEAENLQNGDLLSTCIRSTLRICVPTCSLRPIVLQSYSPIVLQYLDHSYIFFTFYLFIFITVHFKFLLQFYYSTSIFYFLLQYLDAVIYIFSFTFVAKFVKPPHPLSSSSSTHSKLPNTTYLEKTYCYINQNYVFSSTISECVSDLLFAFQTPPLVSRRLASQKDTWLVLCFHFIYSDMSFKFSFYLLCLLAHNVGTRSADWDGVGE